MYATDVNGDPRFTYGDADGYTLLDRLTAHDVERPLLGIEDAEDGYIAFTTGRESADRVVWALDLMEAVLDVAADKSLPPSVQEIANKILAYS